MLPGMNAVATLIDTTAHSENSWLVPTNALVTQGDNATVTVVRDTTTTSIVVTPGSIQGEYTIVQSAELQRVTWWWAVSVPIWTAAAASLAWVVLVVPRPVVTYTVPVGYK